MARSEVKPMVESGILSAVAIIFAFISVYVPLLGAFVNLIWPVPIILLGVRHGLKWSGMATLVAGLVIAMVMHPLQAVSVVVGFGLIGIALGYAMRAGFSSARTLLLGTAASLTAKVAMLAAAAVVMGVNPLNVQMGEMESALAQVVAFYRHIGMSEQDLAQTSASLHSMLDLMRVIFPAALALAAVADTCLNFMVARLVLRKMGHYTPPLPPFVTWSLPHYVFYVYAAATLAAFAGRYWGIKWLYDSGMNIQIVASMLLLVQGLAVFYWFAGKYKLPRLARGIILILIFTNGLFMQILVFIGAFDILFDYRKRKTTGTG